MSGPSGNDYNPLEKKVLLIGRKGVGKDALLNRLMKGSFTSKPKSCSDMDFATLARGGEKPYALDILRCDDMESDDPEFFSKFHAIILVVDWSDDLKEQEGQLRVMMGEHHANFKDKAVQVVFTKTDLVLESPLPLSDADRAQRIIDTKEFVARLRISHRNINIAVLPKLVSAKTGAGVTELFDGVAESLRNPQVKELKKEEKSMSGSNIENHYKMTLIGFAGSGKSSLLSRMADDRFNEGHIPTIGVDFRLIASTLKNGQTYQCQVWDLDEATMEGGSYYPGAQAIVWVVGMSPLPLQSQFEKILDSHRAVLLDKPIYIVLTKKDLLASGELNEFQALVLRLQLKYKGFLKIIGHAFAVSAKEGEGGVKELFDNVAEGLYEEGLRAKELKSQEPAQDHKRDFESKDLEDPAADEMEGSAIHSPSFVSQYLQTIQRGLWLSAGAGLLGGGIAALNSFSLSLEWSLGENALAAGGIIFVVGVVILLVVLCIASRNKDLRGAYLPVSDAPPSPGSESDDLSFRPQPQSQRRSEIGREPGTGYGSPLASPREAKADSAPGPQGALSGPRAPASSVG